MKKLIFAFLLLTVCVITNGQEEKTVHLYLHDPGWYMKVPPAELKTDPEVRESYSRLAEQYRVAKQQQRINELEKQINELKVGDKKIESKKTVEISLYDKTGHAKAYVVSGQTVYLWNGSPVAYFSRARNGEEIWHIYNFDGKHIGWTIPGILFDNNGYVVCGVRNMLDIATYAERAKPTRKARRYKVAKESAPPRPLFKRMLWSSTSLEELFHY